MGSVEREHDSVTIDAGEVGPCWAMGSVEWDQQCPRKTLSCRVILPHPGGQAEKWARKCHVIIKFFSF